MDPHRPAPSARVDPARVAAAHARRPLREWPVAIVLVGVAISLVVVVDNHFRRGSVLLALSVLLAAALRLLLPARVAGVLAVRSRVLDVLILGGLGTGLLVLALVVPPPR